MASGSGASSSRQPPSPPQDEEEDEEDVIYSCAREVASTLNAAKLKTLVDRYQIPREFNPRLPEAGEWCCSPSSGLGVYASYLLAGLKFPGDFRTTPIPPACSVDNPSTWMTYVLLSSLSFKFPWHGVNSAMKSPRA